MPRKKDSNAPRNQPGAPKAKSAGRSHAKGVQEEPREPRPRYTPPAGSRSRITTSSLPIGSGKAEPSSHYEEAETAHRQHRRGRRDRQGKRHSQQLLRTFCGNPSCKNKGGNQTWIHFKWALTLPICDRCGSPFWIKVCDLADNATVVGALASHHGVTVELEHVSPHLVVRQVATEPMR